MAPREPQAEPAYIDRTKRTRSDREIWADILGADVMPWDTTTEEQIAMRDRSRPIEPVDKRRNRS